MIKWVKNYIKDKQIKAKLRRKILKDCPVIAIREYKNKKLIGEKPVKILFVYKKAQVCHNP